MILRGLLADIYCNGKIPLCHSESLFRESSKIVYKHPDIYNRKRDRLLPILTTNYLKKDLTEF
jgi:hypothetical protein